MAIEIASVSDIKTYLGLTETEDTVDAQLQYFVDQLSDYIFTQTQRWFGCVKTKTEVHDWQPAIFLDEIDVREILYIKRGYSESKDYDNDTNLTTLDSSAYVWSDTGRIVLAYPYKYNRSRKDYEQVVVQFKYGNETVPGDLKLAATQFVADGFRAIDGEITSESVGDFRRSYKPSTQAADIFGRY